MKPAVCLLSGGMDSACAAAIAGDEGFALHALTVRYGQRHHHEIEAATRVARHLGAVAHRVVDLDLRWIGGSALTGDVPVPKDRPMERIAAEIPPTYVPARNTIFLALALGWAEVLAARDLFLGVNALDYSGYPDCRPDFLLAFERVARLGTRAGAQGEALRIHAPLVRMSKAEIVRRAVELGVDLSLTHSCYDPAPDGAACARCDACRLRRKGFLEAGVPDPTRYA
jgi:7-cyano-7-deazaguanine synthase